MLANHEHRLYPDHSLVWVGKYRDLKNISHWHFDHEIAACEDGEALISLNQETFTLRKGQCIYLRGQSVHSILSAPGTTLYVSLFSDDLLRRVTDNYCLAHPVFEDDFRVLETLERIRAAGFKKERFYDEISNALMQQLIAEIFSVLEIRSSAVLVSAATERYKKLLYDIDENAETYSFLRAVEFMNMSEAYFSRFFKRISGMTFSMYLNHIRVNRAIDLIKNTDLSMTEIAMTCGFETIRNFNRVFRQITGYAPRELPDGYVMNLRSNSGNASNFDPTIRTSELMYE
jgi:xylan 1,4-beta-xylosidase